MPSETIELAETLVWWLREVSDVHTSIVVYLYNGEWLRSIVVSITMADCMMLVKSWVHAYVGRSCFHLQPVDIKLVDYDGQACRALVWTARVVGPVYCLPAYARTSPGHGRRRPGGHFNCGRRDPPSSVSFCDIMMYCRETHPRLVLSWCLRVSCT